MGNFLDDLLDTIRQIWCDIKRFIHRVVWHLPERGWRWLPNHPTWKAYMPSEEGGNRPYTCAEYVESRIRSLSHFAFRVTHANYHLCRMESTAS